MAVLGVVAMLLGTFLYVFHSLRKIPGEAVAEGRKVLADLGRVAAAFNQGTVTTSFLSYATEIEGSSYFQFATLKQTEVFERRDAASTLWGYLELPAIVVRATAPVETTYYVDLDGRWEFTSDGHRIHVVAPPIRFNTPAVDVSKLRLEVAAGSLLRDEQQALDRLREGITHLSFQRARENIPLVRETARQRVEAFVGQWLAERFVDGDDFDVEVRFRDELPYSGIPSLRPGPERETPKGS
ncbi:MAG: hypothetical protein KDD11_01970 [Acidobacteria bacterium]|nr:hypothetical protein [Acidobacteriota bacterium]